MTPEQAAELARTLFELEARGQTTPPHWSEAEFLAELQSPESRAFLWRGPDAPADGPLAGFVLYRFAGEEAWVLNIAVGEKGRGLGARLMMAFLAELRQALPAAKQLGLEVRAGNAAAAALYVSSGFQRVGVRARYYRDGQDAHVYLLPL